ncbi:MAG: septation protein IspZ [Alphaproteobacteria bacterium]|nr:septation protein IspZ [Alphaproteobacteria bacterium]
MNQQGMTEKKEGNAKDSSASLSQIVFDIVSLLLFFGSNALYGIFIATGLFMTTTLLGIIITYVRKRRIAVNSLITAFFVMIFGGMTLYLQNETFIKIKLTLLYLLFALLLGAGLASKRIFLKTLMQWEIQMSMEGWYKLTWRMIIFFIFDAALNEIIWRNFSTDTWVSFKTFGILPLMIIFVMAQIPLIQRYQINKEDKIQNSGTDSGTLS